MTRPVGVQAAIESLETWVDEWLDSDTSRRYLTVVRAAQIGDLIDLHRRKSEQAQQMVWAIHSAVEAIDHNNPDERNDIIRSLAEAAYAYDGGWLTKADYGVKPEWMSDEMWKSLDDPPGVSA